LAILGAVVPYCFKR